MMRNKHKLLIEQLDLKLKPFLKPRMIPVPDRGWIRTIRTSLNMTMAQLGSKLDITRQGVKRIEESEAKGTITINLLKEVANALDLKLVYALVPKTGNIEDLVELKAKELAKRIVLRTDQNMKLENQGIREDRISKNIEELAQEIKRDVRKSLWD